MQKDSVIASMAGCARSIDAAMMPHALTENIYNDDILLLNSSIIFQTRNTAKIDSSIPRLFTRFSTDFLTTLANTPLSSIEMSTNKSMLMFKLVQDDNPLLTRFFDSSSLQAKRIKSDQKSILFLAREAARIDISIAQQITGFSVNQLITLANKSSIDITKMVKQNCYVYEYRGREQSLKQSFLMPQSNNAKMIALSVILQQSIQTP